MNNSNGITNKSPDQFGEIMEIDIAPFNRQRDMMANYFHLQNVTYIQSVIEGRKTFSFHTTMSTFYGDSDIGTAGK